MISGISPGPTGAERTLPKEGKILIPGRSNNHTTRLLQSRSSNNAELQAYRLTGTAVLQGLQDDMLHEDMLHDWNNTLRSLVAPGKQGPADYFFF